jgi:YbbR domain-containing protein
MKLARVLTHNFGAKVLALAVAILVWFNASGQEEVVRLHSASVVLEGLSDTLAVSNAVPATAEIRITSSRRRVVTLSLRRLDVVVDLSGLGPGRQRIPLSGHNVRGAGGIDAARMQVVSPAVLEVDLDPMATRRVQVSLSTQGVLPSNVMLLDGGVSIDPAWVTVRGPASALDRVQHVNTEPVDLSRVHDTDTREVELRCGPPSVRCEPSRVSITLRVSTRGERVLANVEPTVLLDVPDVGAEVEPATVSLTLNGPSAVLDTLSAGDVSVLVELRGGTPATYRVAPRVILPAGVSLAGISADTLAVRVFRNGR